MTIIPLKYLNICLISFKFLRVRQELNIANKLSTNVIIFNLVLFVRCMNTLIVQRYGSSRARSLSSFSQDESVLYL